MGYLIAYLLLALAIDLIRELFNPQGAGRNAAAIRRRLWSERDFDCCSRVFGEEESASRRQPARTPQAPPRVLWRKPCLAGTGKRRGFC